MNEISTQSTTSAEHDISHAHAEIWWPSPAKLNLFLYINGQRDDGYHELQTLFQFLDYGDALRFDVNLSGQIRLQPAIEGVALEDNLIYKAAIALKAAAASISKTEATAKTGTALNIERLGVDISLDKKLPMGGGLGGGSSNAATVLVALNALWKLGLSNDALAEIGLALGADVPIFVRGWSAFAEGVGEKLTPSFPDNSWYLVIKPNVDVATADVFTHPELTRNTPKRDFATLSCEPYENDCEKIVTLLYPEVAKQLSWLLQYTAARLTGTGACVFAQFEHKSHAEHVLHKLPKNVLGFIAQGVNQSPLLKTLANITP